MTSIFLSFVELIWLVELFEWGDFLIFPTVMGKKKKRKFIDFILLYICSRKFGFRWWKILLWWVFRLKDACNQINLFELLHSIKISDSMFHCHSHFICVYFDLMIYFYRLTFTRFIFRLHFNRKTFTLNSMYHMFAITT